MHNKQLDNAPPPSLVFVECTAQVCTEVLDGESDADAVARLRRELDSSDIVANLPLMEGGHIRIGLTVQTIE